MTKTERAFINTVWKHYQENGRHDLPWRQTHLAYRIVVSEIMLQQTQVSRVVEKYQMFLKTFPSTKRLAEAPLASVLTAWQGLGYNRRAKLLQQAADVVHREYNGRWPRSYEGLLALPGIGAYTAGAVSAFAYNQPVPIIETNIRTVYLHHFYPQATAISDTEILALVKRTLDTTNPREWYWALMDYGAYLKVTNGSRNQQSRHYTKQAPFAGSAREVRGAIVRFLTIENTGTEHELRVGLKKFANARITAALASLIAEEMVVYNSATDSYQLPG